MSLENLQRCASLCEGKFALEQILIVDYVVLQVEAYMKITWNFKNICRLRTQAYLLSEQDASLHHQVDDHCNCQSLKSLYLKIDQACMVE
jgi:hypothetical protein